MSNLVVVTFDDEQEAGKVLKTLRGIEKRGLLSLDDSAVVVKDAEGKIHIKNETDRGVKIGAVGGGILGLLIGGVFFPLAGLIGGTIAGALMGKMADLGIEQKFVREVGAALTPGSSAIFVLVGEADPDVALAALKPYQGQVYHTSMAAAAEQNLRDILSKRI